MEGDPDEGWILADSFLGDAVLPTVIASERREAPRSVFVTGCTGFLGTFVLEELLRVTELRIFCLVRAGSREEGLQRLAGNLRHYCSAGIADPSRITVFCGDLALPRLGLDDAAWGWLSRETDAILHIGARMNFYQSYATLRAANVEGTRALLALALSGRPKSFHHVSSSGVFDSEPFRGVRVTEADYPCCCRRSVNGYTQTKWVAERLVVQARERGLPVCLHRPPFLTGHSLTGRADPDNLLVKLVLGSLQASLWPDERAFFDFVPVDYVSRSIALLLRRPDIALGRTFHYAGRQHLTLSELGDIVERCGFRFSRLPYLEWRQALRGFVHEDRQNALRPLAPLFLKAHTRLGRSIADSYMLPPRVNFDGAQSNALLSAAGVDAPDLGVALFRVYCRWFQESGWLRTSPAMQP